MTNFLECGNSILLVVKWPLSGVTKLYINFNLQKITDQLLILGTIFINKLLIELNFLKNEKKQKKNKKKRIIKKKTPNKKNKYSINLGKDKKKHLKEKLKKID